ncbi:MAG: hypothetical protein K8Q97_04200 [Candidatus Andersenbacteria bacterium]|nr:hypothetical protein [Candidatus Andersenbacteria bacterium]
MSAVIEKKDSARMKRAQAMQQVSVFTLTEMQGLVSPGDELKVDYARVCCACTNCAHYRTNNTINPSQRLSLAQAGSRTVLVHADCPKQPTMQILMPLRRDLLEILAKVKGVEVV